MSDKEYCISAGVIGAILGLMFVCFLVTGCGPVPDDGCVGEYCFDDYEPCGDGVCQTDEDCPEDCAGVFCGNYICNPLWGEDEETCPTDCGWWCGDGICNGNENEHTCDHDCGRGPLCGDYICEPPLEDDETCFVDCGCGNGRCDVEQGESESNCYVDCGQCGNGFCAFHEDNIVNTEDQWSCPEDCNRRQECGDLICEFNESPETCPQDCFCRNLACDETETVESCPEDCTEECGDGVCDETADEDWLSCPRDCRECNDAERPIDCEDGTGCWPQAVNCHSDTFLCGGLTYRCNYTPHRANCCNDEFHECPEELPYYCPDTDSCGDYDAWQACPSREDGACTTVNNPCGGYDGD